MNNLLILVTETDLSKVFVVDFGNALRNTEDELSLYYTDFELQTLLYRAPEVIFGLHFGIEVMCRLVLQCKNLDVLFYLY